jgi:hypothetical protein
MIINKLIQTGCDKIYTNNTLFVRFCLFIVSLDVQNMSSQSHRIKPTRFLIWSPSTHYTRH